jgi:predicted RNase H-like HicB family nuclease
MAVRYYVIEVMEDELDGGYVVECVNLPGCMSQGETVEEAFDNIGEAIGGVIAARFERNLTLTGCQRLIGGKADAMQSVADGMVEVLLTLSPAKYAEMGQGIERLRDRLGMPRSASNTELILRAVQVAGEES